MDCRDPTPIGLVYPSRTLVHLSFLLPALGVQVYESNHTLFVIVLILIVLGNGKHPATLSFLLELPVFAPGPLPSTLPEELSGKFNKAMHDEFGYLGAPGVVPKRAVTAQMLRDLVNFQSSLPVNDQWMIKSWIRLLQPFAEDRDILPSLGDSRPGELLNHFSGRRNNIGATTFNNTSDLSVKDTDPPLDSSI